jgi:hypothetical protein
MARGERNGVLNHRNINRNQTDNGWSINLINPKDGKHIHSDVIFDIENGGRTKAHEKAVIERDKLKRKFNVINTMDLNGAHSKNKSNKTGVIGVSLIFNNKKLLFTTTFPKKKWAGFLVHGWGDLVNGWFNAVSHSKINEGKSGSPVPLLNEYVINKAIEAFGLDGKPHDLYGTAYTTSFNAIEKVVACKDDVKTEDTKVDAEPKQEEEDKAIPIHSDEREFEFRGGSIGVDYYVVMGKISGFLVLAKSGERFIFGFDRFGSIEMAWEQAVRANALLTGNTNPTIPPCPPMPSRPYIYPGHTPQRNFNQSQYREHSYPLNQYQQDPWKQHPSMFEQSSLFNMTDPVPWYMKVPNNEPRVVVVEFQPKPKKTKREQPPQNADVVGESDLSTTEVFELMGEFSELSVGEFLETYSRLHPDAKRGPKLNQFITDMLLRR